MWYYAISGERKGPVNEAALVDLARGGVVDGSTLVWTVGMIAWAPLAQTDLARDDPGLADALSAAAPRAVARPRRTNDWATRPDRLPDYAPESLDRLYAGTIVSFFLWLVLFFVFAAIADDDPEPSAAALLLLPFFGAFAAWIVCYCKLVFRMWEQVQDGHARSTPDKAAGFLWIPVFNYYWQFVAVHGLSLELLRVMHARGISWPRPSSGVALACCICCVAWIVCYLAFPAAIVMWLIAFSQMKNASKAILEHRIGHARGTPGPLRG